VLFWEISFGRRIKKIVLKSQEKLERTKMRFGSLFAVVVVGLAGSVVAVPIYTSPCTDEVLDKILSGKADAATCCSYGVCMGTRNIQATRN